MIVTMQADADSSATDDVAGLLRSQGYEVHAIRDSGASVIGVNGRPVTDDLGPTLAQLPGVAAVVIPSGPYKLAAREVRPGGTVVRVGDVEIGGSDPVVIAGPCAIENREQALRAARAARQAGARILRGGAFKPRTSPYSFQGLGDDGLKLLAEMRDLTGLPVVTEVMEPDQVDLVAEYADALQVGSRNMMNFPLLRRVATCNKPVLLKRGFAATIEEWLLSAEYILAGGNDRVILCERGIRSFDPSTRFTLDLNAVPLVRRLTHLPIIVDPSHGTGKRELVPAMSLAGIAAGAHGLIIEVHPDPEHALSDGRQSITPDTLVEIVTKTRALSALLQAGAMVTV
ncbi:3-deoxy-7-phosphoheptulonate synthase [Nitrolancea hollandica]|uniref:Phospho-2-dehydro-3-deoxyheptonate aldolase n=1 Tax=Nitrolancea hollandica Lb TaxID=1129897 RepID=I4EHX6_9BACT|nr:3-deoxy-7-phosphoheptulonate synthase [Nitrolancea hollandica]CCF84288.1 Phospho-2-dehydro-3-deoxyheptonate aldolase [Nitrolancea hollandica Lb]